MMTDWNFADVFERVSSEIPDSLAIISGNKQHSWREFNNRSSALSAELDSIGVPVQSNVAVYLRNSAEFLESYNGILKSRLVPVNVNYRYGADELIYLLDDSDAQAVIVHAEFADLVEIIAPRLTKVRRWYVVGGIPNLLQGLVDAGFVFDYEERIGAHLGAAVPPRRRPGSDRLMIYTGGTTGMPKGVVWRQNDLFEALIPSAWGSLKLPSTLTMEDLVASIVQPGPRGLTASPMMHGTGLLQQFVILLSGGTAVILDSQRFSARELWRTVAEQRVAAVVIVGDAFAGPMLDVLEEELCAFDLSSLKVISSSGAIWSRANKEGLLRHLPSVKMLDTLASSEGFGVATSVVTVSETEETGHFILGEKVRVKKADGTIMKPGEPGSGTVLVQGPLPLGYYKDPEKSKATFSVIDGVRYSASGDFVNVLSNGRVEFLGRGSSCINTGGEKVFVEEVDQVLRGHPGIADAACVGAPDKRFGSIVCAVVAFRLGVALSQDEVSAYVRDRLASYKAPRRLVVVDEVPRTAQGKLDYRLLSNLVVGV